MSTPTLLAQSQILAYRCVKMTTTPGFVAPATSSTDAILGVTTAIVTTTNGAVTLQENENGLVLLTAGGTIAAGDMLTASTNGTVVATGLSNGQFMSTENASSGEILWAKAIKSDSTAVMSGVYGSNRAGQFIRDAKNGVDSVDFITLGDSNACHPASYGFQGGIMRVMSYQYGVQAYATSLNPAGSYLNSFSFSGLLDGTLMTGSGTNTNSDNTAGTTGSTVTSRMYPQYTSDSEINALMTNLNFSTTDWNTAETGDGLTMLPKPNVWMWMPQVVATGGIYVGGQTSNSVRLGPGVSTASNSPIAYGIGGTGGVNCQYRLVCGTFNASGGSFKLSVWNQNSFALNVRSSSISTQTVGGGYGYKTEKLNFTTQTSANPGVYCSWDGAQSGASEGVTGPFAAMWASVIGRNRKGYSASNLIGHGGITGTGLASRIEGMDKVLDMYLKEIRERQVEAGGSGRVIIFVNYGINTDSSPTVADAWINAANRIKTRILARWQSTGGSASNIAFIFSPSHPIPAAAALGWVTNRAPVMAAAASWGSTNANDGSGTCVLDIESHYSITKLEKGSAPTGTLYSAGPDYAHLSGVTNSGLNGFDAVVGAMFNSLLLST